MNRRIAGRISLFALGLALAGTAVSAPADGVRTATQTTAAAAGHVGHALFADGGHRHKRHRRRHALAPAIRLDTDGDGRISTIEAASSRLNERFGEIDRNRDGYLVRSELEAAARQRRQAFAAKRAQRFEAKFIEADGNRDGRLSRAEVEAAWPQRARAFAYLDENRDGYLVRADLAPRRR